MQINRLQSILLAILAGLVLFIPFLGGAHLFDWDEINFAESAREMIRSGNYLNVQINYEPFWEKPPLFIWMQVLSMKLFGVGEFAARFPNAICGIVTLIVLFRVGEKVVDKKFAYLWMLVYSGSILPFFYFKSGIIDPWFNLFIFLGIVHFAWYFSLEEKRKRNLSLSAFFIGLAIITKGPVALLVLMLVFLIYLIVRRFKIKTSIQDVLLYIGILSITGGFWFILLLFNGNGNVIIDFINYQIRLFSTQDAGHGGFFLYHFVVLLIGVFPASVFALMVLFSQSEKKSLNIPFKLWMNILFWVVLLLFTIVKTKIVHYSSLCYFPLTFLATIAVYQLINKQLKWNKLLSLGLFAVTFLFSILVIAVSLIGMFPDKITELGLKMDEYTKANLSAEVYWSGFEIFIGIGFLILVTWLLFFQKNIKYRAIGIFISSLAFVYLTIIFITPRIEGYSQRAAIQFFKSINEEDAYVATLGYKSYAHLYYSDLKPYAPAQKINTEWLLAGQIDKNTYFVFKIDKKEKYLNQYPQLIYLYEKNGFVFTKRKMVVK